MHPFYEPETSAALGFGFRCGFLGLLHLEIIQERLEREYNLDLVTTAPSVIYKVHKTDGTVIDLTNPSNLPDPSEIDYMEEPLVKAEIMVTTDTSDRSWSSASRDEASIREWNTWRRRVRCFITISR